jgi:ribosomal protein L22
MTPEIEPEQEPKRSRRRRRRKVGPPEAAPAAEAPRAESEAPAELEATRGAWAADATPESSADGEPEAVVVASDVDPQAEVEQTPEAVEAEDGAADLMLEADAEAEDGESQDDEAEEDDESENEQPGAEEPSGSGTSRRLPLRRRRKATEPPAKPAPARRRSRREPGAPIPVVRAQAKYVRSSARKARLVCDHIRGKSVEEARAILALTPRAIARDWSKLLESAVANAEHNHELVGEDLYVKAVHADEGPTIKRFRPRAMGRATRIRKRTSHLTILLTPKE